MERRVPAVPPHPAPAPRAARPTLLRASAATGWARHWWNIVSCPATSCHSQLLDDVLDVATASVSSRRPLRKHSVDYSYPTPIIPLPLPCGRRKVRTIACAQIVPLTDVRNMTTPGKTLNELQNLPGEINNAV